MYTYNINFHCWSFIYRIFRIIFSTHMMRENVFRIREKHEIFFLYIFLFILLVAHIHIYVLNSPSLALHWNFSCICRIQCMPGFWEVLRNVRRERWLSFNSASHVILHVQETACTESIKLHIKLLLLQHVCVYTPTYVYVRDTVS